MSSYTEAFIPEVKAAELIGDGDKFSFVLFTDCGKMRVYVYPDGSVKAYGSGNDIINELAACLQSNIGKDPYPGQDFCAVVTRVASYSCKVAVPPFGSGCVDPAAAIASGWRPGMVVRVWLETLDRAGENRYSAKEVQWEDQP